MFQRLLFIIIGSITSLTGCPYTLADLNNWNAGEDFAAAERDAGGNNPATETNFVNQSVPVWSYGFRTNAEGWASTAFHGALPGFHVNDFNNGFFTNNTFDGFLTSGDGSFFVNYTDVASPHFQGVVNSHEIFFHPASGNSVFPLIRFTAPQDGLYSLSGYWRHLNTANSGDGGMGHTVLNGIPLDTQSWTMPDGSSHPFSFSSLPLLTGDTIDFVIDAGINNDYLSDSTAFNASVSLSAVPEPSSFILLGIACSGLVMRKARQLRKNVEATN